MFQSTDVVTINACDIIIKKITYNTDVGLTIKSQDIKMDPENEIITILFPKKLPVGKSGFLYMEFQGIINDKLKGLYRSKYTR